jgi:epoxide hydrolase-like predicted phosphatase
MNKIKAIGFDYGGVIGGGHSAGSKFTKEISQALGISTEEYRKKYFSMNYLINTGKIATWLEFWKIFLDEIKKPEKLNEVMIISNKTSKKYQKIDEKVKNLILKLKKRGYKVGLLSNATKESAAQMRELGVNTWFDVFHVSGEIGLQKPDPKVFQNFANKLGVNISELVFIDDAEKSLSSAKKTGFTPILFTGYEDLVKNLKKMQIL